VSPPEPGVDDGVLRRTPYSDNPRVGAKGTRTRRRILRAALGVFGQVGYHACNVERITAVVGCSRPTFYQYFSSMEDVFRHLAGQLAHDLTEINEALGPITPDIAGRARLREWLGRFGDLYDEYAPLFAVFSVAAHSDEVVASGALQVQARLVAGLAASVPKTAWPGDSHEVTALVLLGMLMRAHRYRKVLGAPEAGDVVDLGRDRLDDALADFMHRTMYGPLRGVNVCPPVAPVIDYLDTRAVSGGAVVERRALGAVGRATRAQLLAAATKVFIERGYDGTNVADIVLAAGISHGTFYIYFANKDEVLQILAAKAYRQAMAAVEAIPEPATVSVRQWLEEYAHTYADAGPLIRIFIEAVSLDPALRATVAQAVDMVRQRLVRFAAARGEGDADADALVLLALLDLALFFAPGQRVPESAVRDAVAAAIERGFVTH